ncbi:hypothetical protein FSD66_23380, partial [Salmonella enterica subsp. enterica serovar Chailey]|nr:hypothetical protein [Salmonella enterica]EBE8989433.1 hypothetical protein [Salmonella enterica subsp. enterica serovar Chailey]EDB5291306.1 hypothetical protein [Salmonella enterica subsp. enterica serovar Corvallis]EAN8526827.1 hypothetical protein [Salmonella enterica]EBG4897055.1 hypothetical protein [Salmonella enterica subsp. enterica serovar Chailey]
MNKKQFIKSTTSSKEELEKELNSLKYALCLVYSRLPMEDKNAIYNEMISSLDFNDRDLASHLNSFR